MKLKNKLIKTKIINRKSKLKQILKFQMIKNKSINHPNKMLKFQNKLIKNKYILHKYGTKLKLIKNK